MFGLANLAQRRPVFCALLGAHGLLDNASKWYQGGPACDARGRMVRHDDDGAVCFCAHAAVWQFEPDPYDPSPSATLDAVGLSFGFNDAASTTFQMVKSKLTDALSLAWERGV